MRCATAFAVASLAIAAGAQPTGWNSCQQCNPTPGQGAKCDITTSCIPFVTSNKYPQPLFCACRHGYKADNQWAFQFRTTWSGQEGRVFVAPGVSCNTLCHNPLTCDEVPIRDQCWKNPWGPYNPPKPYGGDKYGNDNYGGDNYGGDNYGGDKYGGDKYGNDKYGGDKYGNDKYGGDKYGNDKYGNDKYGGDKYGNDKYGGDKYGGDKYGGDKYGGDKYGGDKYGNDKYSNDKYGSDSYGGDNSWGAADASDASVMPNAAPDAGSSPDDSGSS